MQSIVFKVYIRPSATASERFLYLVKFHPIQIYLLGLLRYSEKEFMIKPICSFLGLISLLI